MRADGGAGGAEPCRRGRAEPCRRGRAEPCRRGRRPCETLGGVDVTTTRVQVAGTHGWAVWSVGQAIDPDVALPDPQDESQVVLVRSLEDRAREGSRALAGVWARPGSPVIDGAFTLLEATFPAGAGTTAEDVLAAVAPTPSTPDVEVLGYATSLVDVPTGRDVVQRTVARGGDGEGVVTVTTVRHTVVAPSGAVLLVWEFETPGEDADGEFEAACAALVAAAVPVGAPAPDAER